MFEKKCYMTVNDMIKYFQELSDKGYGDRLVSCCGMLDLCIYLPADEEYITIDTEEIIDDEWWK